MSSFDWWRIPLFLVTSIVEIRLKSHDKFNNLEVSKQIQWPMQPGLSSNPTWPIASVNHHAFTILPSRNSLTFHCINHWKWWPFGLRLSLFPQFQTALAKLWFSGMAVGLRGCVLKRGCDAESKSGYRWYRLMCPARFAVRTERKHAMQCNTTSRFLYHPDLPDVSEINWGILTIWHGNFNFSVSALQNWIIWSASHFYHPSRVTMRAGSTRVHPWTRISMLTSAPCWSKKNVTKWLNQ